jgi:murein DD-endopeptidase MepM/ murein hydrolase activator NlpD
MTRLVAVAMLALSLVGAASASAQSAPRFAVVGGQSSSPPALPSAEIPNSPGSLTLPPGWTARPLVTRTMSFAQLNALWHRAGAAYGIPWEVLAAINKIETNFGRNMGPSSAGAVGWMQFMPATWLRWGTDATGEGIADPWDPEDAVFSAARYLAAAGARTDLYRGVFAYNHADWYVRDVLELARVFGKGGGSLTFTLDRLQVGLDETRDDVARANRLLVEAVRAARAARRAERALLRRAAAAELLSDRLELERRAFSAGVEADEAAALVESRQAALDEAKAALDAAAAGAPAAAAAPGVSTLLSTPQFAAGYAFPVGGGPTTVSVAHDHHDYPAADIAAPSGAPVYALTNGVVLAAWPLPSGRCGIGFILVAGDGRQWTYCHLSFLEPKVVAGAALTVAEPVGLVGATGTTASGPHLHLQIGPVKTYPQEEPWFEALAGIAFSWQDGGETQPWPVAPFSPVPVFAVVEQTEPVFEVVSSESEVVEFTVGA